MKLQREPLTVGMRVYDDLRFYRTGCIVKVNRWSTYVQWGDGEIQRYDKAHTRFLHKVDGQKSLAGKESKKGNRDREMRDMYLKCQDVRIVAAHFRVSVQTVRKNIRKAERDGL